MLRLAFHQDVQAKVFAEVGKWSLEEIEQVSAESAPYLTAVIHEVLRLHPPVMLVPLQARGDQDISNGSLHHVRDGYRMDISLVMIQLNPKIFLDPETFRPERFLNANGHFENSHGMVAFNVGPRACLGRNVALLEISVAAALMIQRVEVHPVNSWDESSQWISKITREFKYPTKFNLVLR